MHRTRAFPSLLLALLAPPAIGCDRVTMLPPENPAEVEILFEDWAIRAEYSATVDRVAAMVGDAGLTERVARRGLDVVNAAWEDTSRAEGSSPGPNISDVTLQVRRRDPSVRYADALMPVLRYPNFTDRTGDMPTARFFVRVGNEQGAGLVTVPLAELLRDLRRFSSSPGKIPPRAVFPGE